MRLKNILITVTDMDRAKRFYKEMFGLDVILDSGGNVILTEGLVLQDRALWEQTTGAKAIPYNNSALLYFEERDMDFFAQKLKKYSTAEIPSMEIPFMGISSIETHSNRQVLRFYDPDGNLIEVGPPWR